MYQRVLLGELVDQFGVGRLLVALHQTLSEDGVQRVVGGEKSAGGFAAHAFAGIPAGVPTPATRKAFRVHVDTARSPSASGATQRTSV